MANLFSLIKPRGKKESLQRQNFDLNNGHVYSSKAGIIEPIKAIHCVPKDFMDIDVSDFTQTTAMNTAAFLRARKEISAYFVPYNYIWSNYNQYQATREDPKSSALAQKGIAFEPRIPLWVLYLSAAELFYGYIYCKYALKLIRLAQRPFGMSYTDYLNSDRFKVAYDEDLSSWKSDESSSASFQFMRDTEQATHFYPASDEDAEPVHRFMGVDKTNEEMYFDVCGNYKWSYWLRKLDMLGYGNLYPIFKEFEDFASKQFDATINLWETDPDTQYDEQNVETDWNTNSNGTFPVYYTFVRTVITSLREMSSATDLVSNYSTNPRYVSIYPLYAYNHIFYHMFRNSYFDLSYNVRNYNVDYKDCSSFNGSIIWFDELDPRFFELAHHQYKKDMFTGVLPDVQFGVVSSVNISGVNILNDLSSDTSIPVSVQASSVPSGSTIPPNSLYKNYTSNSHFWSIPSAFDVLALKRAEMLQVYHQNLMRAGNRTSDIFKALYGSDPKSEMHSSPYFVEVLGEDINVNSVIATASTGQSENGSLGDIAARGLFSGSRSMKFSTEDFGTLIFLAYIVPEPYYNSTRIDPHLMNLSPEDHLIPELMNLGFSPVLGEWLSNYSSPSKLNAVRGYTPPYVEFKTDVNLAHGAMASALIQRPSSAFIPSAITFTHHALDFQGSLSHWITTRFDMQSDNATRLSQFYINPKVLDSIFLVANDDTPETDQFICQTFLRVSATRLFSALGLPSF